MAYVKKSEIKEFARGRDVRVSAEFFDALDAVIEWHLKKAVERAEANGRKTLKAADL